MDNKLTEDDINNIIEEVDEDGSGTLDFDGDDYDDYDEVYDEDDYRVPMITWMMRMMTWKMIMTIMKTRLMMTMMMARMVQKLLALRFRTMTTIMTMMKEYTIYMKNHHNFQSDNILYRFRVHGDDGWLTETQQRRRFLQWDFRSNLYISYLCNISI